MASTSSSALRKVAKPAVRSAVEASVIGAIGFAISAAFFKDVQSRRAIAIGLGTAWVVSTLSAVAIMVAKTVSQKAFWWSFGGGMGLRFATLAGLMALTVVNDGISQAGVLLSYAFGVLAFLLVEYRHVRLK